MNEELMEVFLQILGGHSDNILGMAQVLKDLTGKFVTLSHQHRTIIQSLKTPCPTCKQPLPHDCDNCEWCGTAT